jgi:hypothetical protein
MGISIPKWPKCSESMESNTSQYKISILETIGGSLDVMDKLPFRIISVGF